MKRLKLTLIGELNIFNADRKLIDTISITARVTEAEAELLKSISDDFKITHPEKYPILEVEEIK